MILDNISNLNIIQIGVGGTGSWLVWPVIKFLKNIRARYTSDDLSIDYKLVDNDTVETHNILRQNFMEWDIGRKKVSVMRRNWGPYFENLGIVGEKITTPKKMNDIFCLPRTAELLIFIGCVDNNKTRRSVYNYIKKFRPDFSTTIYMDSGNNLHNGQIVTSLFEPDGACFDSVLNNAHRFNNPKFMKIFPAKDDQEDDGVGCAFFGDQSQSINQLASNMLFLNLQKILIEGILPPPIMNFNSSGYCTFDV